MKKQTRGFIILFGLCFFFLATSLFAEDISVQAQLSQRNAYVGEAIVYQIQVTGSDSPDQPDLSGFTDFNVSFMGGQNTNQTFQMTVNGQTTRYENKGYVFQYKLIPKGAGNLTVPSIDVKVNGRIFRTGASSVYIQEPVEVDNFKARVSLSKSSCYIGEQIYLSVTLYFGANIQSPIFSVPLLNDDRFHFIPVDQSKSTQKDDLVNIQVNDEEMIMKIAQGTLNGQKYNTLSFSMIVIPRVSGDLVLDKATVSFDGVSGYRNVQDFFGRTVRKEQYSKFVVPSNQARLTSLELPRANRPPGFSGLVGEYKVAAEAYPLEVKVGDPITYTVKLSGGLYMQYDDIPDLNELSAFNENFKIPKDRAPGKIQGSEKLFLHTIRASNKDVKEIPSLEIPCFNTKTGKYEKIVAPAIPIEVEPTATLTYLDVQGEDPEEIKKDVESWKEGIAYNYTGPSVLRSQNAGLSGLTHPAMLLFLIILPLAYLVLLYMFRLRPLIEARRNPVKLALQQVLKNLGNWDESLSSADQYNVLLEQLKYYFGAKFSKKAGALTFADLKPILQSEKTPQELIDEVRSIYEVCEAARYANQGKVGVEEMKTRVINLINQLERGL
ncbi:MAG: BatD family protein [Spirochaetales bacterium]|nr:BatD family protein [Spirochaetales bacterium]